MDQGPTMTSSPGSTPTAPRAQIRPEVLEFTAMACFTPKSSFVRRKPRLCAIFGHLLWASPSGSQNSAPYSASKLSFKKTPAGREVFKTARRVFQKGHNKKRAGGLCLAYALETITISASYTRITAVRTHISLKKPVEKVILAVS